MTKSKIKVFIPVLVFSLVPCAALADMSWTEEVTSELLIEEGVSEKEVLHSSIRLKQGGARIDDVEDGTRSYCNFTNNTCVIYEQSAKLFEVVTTVEMKRRSMKETLEREHAVRRGISPVSVSPGDTAPQDKGDPRMQAEFEAIKERRRIDSQSVRFFATEDYAEIDGRNCRKYLGMASYENYIEAWIAEDIAAEQPFLDYRRLVTACKPPQYRYYAQLPGFPIKLIIRYGPLTVTTLVSDYSEQRVPVSEFLLPEDARESN